MTRLILTADPSTALGLQEAGRADIAVPLLMTRLVWGHCRPMRSLQRYWPRGRHKSQGFIGSIIDSRATSKRSAGKTLD